MKLIKDAFIGTVVFVGVMLIFNIPFPVLRESAALGIFATVGTFLTISSAVALIVVVMGLVGGAIIGVFLSNDKGMVYISGCLGMLVGVLTAYTFEFWFLRSAHTWSWSSWFPAFSGLQAVVILADSLILSLITGDSKKKGS